MGEILYQLIAVAEWLAFAYMGASVLYILVFSLAGLFYKEKALKEKQKQNRIAVLMPGFMEDNVIVAAAKHAVEHNYPSSHFDVVVIADTFLPATITALEKLPLILIEVNPDKRTKANSINIALSRLEQQYNIVVILDSDNLMQPGFLNKINTAYNNGYKAIQGHRTAKNQNTSFAMLDAANEEINNHIFRKGHLALSFSSALIGSAMAFDFNLYKQYMQSIGNVMGEDKELELKLLRDRVKILYLDSAIVLDEKVQNAQVFKNQRRRWLAAQAHHLRRYFFTGVYMLLTKGNLDYFDKTIQSLIAPRVLLLGTLFLINLVGTVWSPILPMHYWYSLLLGTIVALWLGLPKRFYKKPLFRALLNLPVSFGFMLLALLKVGKGRKVFIHTPHSIGDQEN